MTYYNPQRLFIQRIASRLRRIFSALRTIGVNHWLGLLVVVLMLCVLVTLSIVIGGYVYEWRWTSVLKKTFYDWLDLLIVPVVLGIGGYVVARAVTQTEQRTAAKEAQEAQREASLTGITQAYLDQMSMMLLDERQPLYSAQPGDSVSLVARARPLNVLEALDPSRKGSILRFVVDAGLLGANAANNRIIDLTGANLSGADLRRYDLKGMDLSYTNLSGANLRESDLADARLLRANLSSADLSRTRLSGVDLGEADLSRANLSESYLSHVNLEYAELEEADLRDADLSYANLQAANLRDADLKGAHLAGALLAYADLDGTRLTGVDLQDANLTRARLTALQLSESGSLVDATLPDGSKYKG